MKAIMRFMSLVMLPLGALAAVSVNHGYMTSTNEATGDVSLALTGIASQTANFITIVDSASAAMMSVTAAGLLTAVTLTDGTLSATAGAITSATAITASGTIQGGTLSDGTTSSTAGVVTGVVTLTVDSVVVGSGGAAISSDRRLKENVRAIPDAAALLGQLRGVRFDWKASAPGAAQRATPGDVGFIAQEVEEVRPRLRAGVPLTHGLMRAQPYRWQKRRAPRPCGIRC
jgi:hypothetical protein